MPVMTAADWESLVSPPKDLDLLLSRVGCKLYPYDRSIIHYLQWALELGLIAALDEHGPLDAAALPRYTRLNERGARGLLGVLCALGLARWLAGSCYELTPLARDFLVKDSPYYIGGELYAPRKRIPSIFLQNSSKVFAGWKLKLVWRFYGMHFGDRNRLLNQQTRNVAASMAAVNSGEFAGSRSLLDLAGGAGVFSIPLALKYPEVRVSLAELPHAIRNAREFIAAANLTSRFELHGLNVFERPWALGQFDTIFIGNFLHGFDDEACIAVCQECFSHLQPGGKIWLHEMLWNDNKDGPMITALWNVSMSLAGGAQRTYEELAAILATAGFVEPRRVPTATAMELVGAVKPHHS